MVYKPTRQPQARVQPQNIAGAKGLFDQAAAGESLSKTLGVISSNLMQQTYEAEENADVANAILEASKIIKPDGSIDPNLADAAGKVWSSRGMQTYMKSINGTMAAWSEGKLDNLKDAYLLADPFGTDTEAKGSYSESVAALRSSLNNYPVAQSDFDLRQALKEDEIKISQAGEVQKRELTGELTSASEAADSAINRVEVIGRATGEGGLPQILELYKGGFQDALTTIATSPVANPNRGAAIRAAETQFQTQASIGVLFNIAKGKADKALVKNPRGIYSVKEAFRRIAWDVENVPGYLESVMTGLDLKLADRSVIATVLKEEGNQYTTRRESYLAEIDSVNNEALSKFEIEKIHKVNDLDNQLTDKGIMEFVQSGDFVSPYKTILDLMTKRDRKVASLIEGNKTAHTEKKAQLLNRLTDHINIVSNGGKTEGAEQEAMEVLIAASSELRLFPGIRTKISNAFEQKINRDGDKLSGRLKMLEAMISLNGFGSSANAELFKRGDKIASNPLIDKKDAASWQMFTANHIQNQVNARFSEDLKNIANGNELKHYALTDMRDIAVAIGGDALSRLATAINAAAEREYGNNLAAAKRVFELRIDPSDPQIDITPKEGEELLEQIYKKFPDKHSDSTFISMISGLESRLTRYADEHKKEVEIADKLSIYEAESAQNGVPGSENREFIEKHTEIPPVNLDDPIYRAASKDLFLRFGLIHSEFLAYVDNSVMANKEQANRVLTFFNELIVARADADPNTSRDSVREQVLTQLSDNSVSGRENSVRTTQILKDLFWGYSWESAQESAQKGISTSFNSAIKGAVSGFDEQKAEQDPNYVFNLFLEATVDLGEKGVIEGIAESWGFKDQTFAELNFEKWWQSQTKTERKQWILTQFQASPEVKYNLSKNFKTAVVSAARSGRLEASDLEGAIFSTWHTMKGRVGVQYERVDDASFMFIARNTDLIRGNEYEGTIPGPLGVGAAAIERPLAMLGVVGDGVYAPRLVLRPIEHWMNSHGGVPANMWGETEDILRYDIAGAINNAPAEFFRRRNTTRNEVMNAINDGFIYFRAEPLLGQEEGDASWSVHVKVGGHPNVLGMGGGSRVSVLLFEDYAPNYNRMDSIKVFDKASKDGISFGFGDVEFAKIYSYQKIFGEFALRHAIRNELDNSRDLSNGRTVINALNVLADMAGYEKIEMTDENLSQYENYFNFFRVR